MAKRLGLILLSVFVSFSAYAVEKIPIAIMDLQGIDIEQNTARAVSDILRTELFNTGLFRVFERGEMDKILREQQFGQTGLSDVDSAVKVGKLLSAKKVLVGTVSKLGTSFIVNARIIDVERGEMEFADKAKSETETDLDKAVETFARRIAGRIQASTSQQNIVETTVSEPKPVKIKPIREKPIKEKKVKRQKPERNQTASGPHTLRLPAIITASVGLLSAGSFFIWKARAVNGYDTYSNLRKEDADYTSAWKKVQTAQSLQPVSLIVGGSLFVTGAVLYIIDAKRSSNMAILYKPATGLGLTYEPITETTTASYTTRW